jgi:hypothetical protein
MSTAPCNALHHTSRDFQVEKIIQGAASQSPTWLAVIMLKLAPLVNILGMVLDFLWPFFVIIFGIVGKITALAPSYSGTVLYGMLLCFFGGYFPALIIAVETFRQTGWACTENNLCELYAEWKNMRKVNAEDNQRDDNSDGVADVTGLSGKELFTRKVSLFFRTINTDRVSLACLGLWAGFLSVLGALRMHFAQIIALGNSMGQQLEKVVMTYLAPPLAQTLPAKHHKWIHPGLRYVCKAVGVSFGWMIQRVMSQVQSAIQGGLMCSRGILHILNERGITNVDFDETVLDEYLGWGLAAVGVWFQGLLIQAAIPFPISLLCSPFSFADWLLRFLVANDIPGM